MAEAQSTTRSAWLAVGITAAVVIVVGAIFGAPAVIDCTRADAGFGACMHDKLVAARLLPPAPKSATETVAEEQPAPAPSESPATATPDASDLLAFPHLDLVRAEPDGSLVVAGSAAPGDKVEIYANDELLGTATVGASGDWVLVPDKPLPPGGYEIRVTDPDKNKTAEQSVVVVIDKDKTSEPLVVASTPGQASKVLQGLSAPATGAEAAASAPAETAPAPATPAAAGAQSSEGTATEPTSESQPAETAPTQEQAAAAETQTSTPATPAAKPQQPAAETPAAGTAGAEVASAPPSEDVVGDVDKLQKKIDSLAPVVAPTIDAVEIDGDKNYFAGAGQEGATVRVYVDNVHVGDAVVKDGRWLLEATGVLKNKSQRVRADELVAGSANVAARAEVDFIFNVPSEEPAAPEPQPPTAVADAGDAATAKTPEIPQPDFAIDTNTPVTLPTEVPQTTAETQPAPAETQPAPAGTAPATEPTPTTAIPSAPSTAVAANEPAGGTSVEPPEPDFSIDTGIPVIVLPLSPGDEQLAETRDILATPPVVDTTSVSPTPEPTAAPAKAPAAADAAPTSTAENAPAAEPEVPQLVAVPMGDPDLKRFAAGKAIIRRGDNLWTIARRIYGSGFEYVQIYRANEGQIRDPDLIYPGQVFDLPTTR